SPPAPPPASGPDVSARVGILGASTPTNPTRAEVRPERVGGAVGGEERRRHHRPVPAPTRTQSGARPTDRKKTSQSARFPANWTEVTGHCPVGCDASAAEHEGKGLGLGNRLTGREHGMAAKRPVLAVAVAATVVTIGVLAFRGNRADNPVVTRAGGGTPALPAAGGGGDGSADTTLVSAGRPSPDGPRPKEIAAIMGGNVVLLDGRDGRTLRTLATHPEATTGGFPYLEGI